MRAACSFRHRRAALAAYLVGPVVAAREVLACPAHLAAAVDLLSEACRPRGSYEDPLPSRAPQVPVRALIRAARP